MGKPGQTTREKSGLEGNYWIKWMFFGLNVILSHQNALETVSQKVFVNSVLYVNSVNATELNIKASGKSKQIQMTFHQLVF